MPACAKCREELELVLGEPKMPGAFRCPRCKGLWLPDVRAASVDHPERLRAVDADDVGNAALDKRPGTCPRGHGLLSRAAVEGSDFHLDRCSHCNGIWFDVGEWNQLASGFALAHLDRLWDPVWRRAAREQAAAERWEAELRQELGDAPMDQLLGLLETLGGCSPKARTMAMAFMQERLTRK